MPQQYWYFLAGLALGLLVGWLLGRRSPQAQPGSGLEAQVQATTLQQSAGAGIKLVVNGNTVEVPPATMVDIQGLIQSGRKIEAIKRLREATGLNLAAAKSVVESLEKVVG